MTPITMDRRMSWLTVRERTVLGHLMDGRSAEEIAAVEYVALSTVRTYIRGILQKLGVNSQAAAIASVYRTIWPGEADAFTTFNQLVAVA